MSLESQISALVQASNNLTKAVDGKIDEIDSRVSSAENEYNALISGIRSDFPFYRMTKNQELKISGALTVGATGTPDGFMNRSASFHKCEIVAQSESGTIPENKHQEIKSLFMDTIGSIPKFVAPDFAILRILTEVNATGTNGSFYSIYQGPIPNGIPISIGCFIKAEVGDVRFCFDDISNIVPNDGRWHERILRFDMQVGGSSYTHGPHIYVAPGARALIALPAVVAGKVPNGKWGFFSKPKFEHEV